MTSCATKSNVSKVLVLSDIFLVTSILQLIEKKLTAKFFFSFNLLFFKDIVLLTTFGSIVSK